MTAGVTEAQGAFTAGYLYYGHGILHTGGCQNIIHFGLFERNQCASCDRNLLVDRRSLGAAVHKRLHRPVAICSLPQHFEGA